MLQCYPHCEPQPSSSCLQDLQAQISCSVPLQVVLNFSQIFMPLMPVSVLTLEVNFELMVFCGIFAPWICDVHFICKKEVNYAHGLGPSIMWSGVQRWTWSILVQTRAQGGVHGMTGFVGLLNQVGFCCRAFLVIFTWYITYTCYIYEDLVSVYQLLLNHK